MKLKYIVDEDSVVKEYILRQGISRKLGRKIKLYGKILINGKEAKNYFEIHKDDVLEIELEEESNPEIPTTNLPIDIIYEDEYFLVINKPTNLSSQPSKKHYEDNLISRVKSYYQNKGIINNIHLVNRLDYGTSGLLIIAKNGYIHYLLSAIEFEKRYLAFVEGILEEKSGVISLPIIRLENSTIKRGVGLNGQEAITIFKVIKEYENKSLLELQLVTGRCHQIRVHLSHINHPIIGDKLYGNSSDELLLHSYFLKFVHPITKEEILLKKLPNWFDLDMGKL